jgi:6-phosphogluconolactonase
MTMRAVLGFAAVLTLTVGAIAVVHSAAAGRLVYIGTYTGDGSKGIYAFRFNDASGALTPVGLAAATKSPSFLAVSPNRKVLYAVNEISSFEGESAGSVTAFSINAQTGKLTPLNAKSSKGDGPCHLAVDATGRFVAVANYGGGNFSLLPIGADGRLGDSIAILANGGSGPDKKRQEGPHAHAVVFDARNRYLLGADLGLDRVFVYKFDPSSGSLGANDPSSVQLAPGAGPRHVAFHPTLPLAFAINELTSTITSLSWDAAKGRLAAAGSVSSLPAGYSGENTTAEIAVHPHGRFLYGSNRGHDSIGVFAIAPTGTLTLVEHESTRGKEPRNFAIDPSGKWLIAANQKTNTLAVFSIDQETGTLTPVGPLAQVGTPVCVLFLGS